MKLHIKECSRCNRFALRLEGDNEWCRHRKAGYVDEIKQKHEVLTHVVELCEECNRLVLENIAKNAGSVT